MVSRTGRSKSKGTSTRRLLASHARSWLWGRNLVLETLSAGRWPVFELHLASDLSADAVSAATTAVEASGQKPKTSRVSKTRLTQLCGAADHQGYVARVGEYPYASADELVTRARQPALWLLLDGVQDPYNLGAMVRSAEVFGVDGVFLASQGQVGVNSHAARSSAGAVNRLDIACVDGLPSFIARLRREAVRVVGASVEADYSLDTVDLAGPTALVIGNEGSGLSREVMAACNMLAKIPQAGSLNSLNAAAAAAVCLYEVQRQRRQDVSVWGNT